MVLTTRTMTAQPGKRADLVRAWHEIAAPQISQHPGFCQAYILTPAHSQDGVMIILFWEDSTALQSWCDSSESEALRTQLAAFWTQPPGKADYEIQAIITPESAVGR